MSVAMDANSKKYTADRYKNNPVRISTGLFIIHFIYRISMEYISAQYPNEFPLYIFPSHV